MWQKVKVLSGPYRKRRDIWVRELPNYYFGFPPHHSPKSPVESNIMTENGLLLFQPSEIELQEEQQKKVRMIDERHSVGWKDSCGR